MDSTQAEVLKNVLRQSAPDPQHRDFLFRSALRLSQDMTSPWLAEEFRKTIILHGSQYDLRSFVPGLVRTAARGLQQTGTPADIDLLSILLYSNNPGVSKAALAAMGQLDPAATVTKAEQAIERDWVHNETRRELVRYLAQAGAQASSKPSD
jgi:HEAT repeat protein